MVTHIQRSLWCWKWKGTWRPCIQSPHSHSRIKPLQNIENVETKGGNTNLRCKDPYYFVGTESQPFWRRKIKKGLFWQMSPSTKLDNTVWREHGLTECSCCRNCLSGNNVVLQGQAFLTATADLEDKHCIRVITPAERLSQNSDVCLFALEMKWEALFWYLLEAGGDQQHPTSGLVYVVNKSWNSDHSHLGQVTGV